VSFEKGLRICAVATAFGRELGLPRAGLSVVFHTALARHRVHLARAGERRRLHGRHRVPGVAGSGVVRSVL
jgi:hypothetical protein